MAVSTPQLKHNDDDAGEVGRRCTCPCVCGARKIRYKPPYSLTPELAMALEDPLTSFIQEHAMPERKWNMYLEFQGCIQEALDYAFDQWKSLKAKVLLDGSVLRGTALDDSDIDLVVRTEYLVPRSVKSAAHQIITAGLQAKYGIGNVRSTEKRKSAEFVVETINAKDVDDQDDATVETVVLHADVLFDNAKVGKPLTDIQQTFPEEGIKVVQMMKLFQRKVGAAGKGGEGEDMSNNTCGCPVGQESTGGTYKQRIGAQKFHHLALSA
ncbi:hypothetical protein Vretimale_7583 [Volvox reticuliferus]|uniref:Polymerase nucleotidyl transferase domain-containing protein n=1 Tax=Volvox reticuliferus TaxID=1737510 RepID=A0A8J4LMR2_9CHLO|nr:hypothetical protein Vretimale_7583 [Volvox reticuliferus]